MYLASIIVDCAARAGSASCCEAMEAEMKLGDTLLVERANGAGMTVRYLLPVRCVSRALRKHYSRERVRASGEWVLR